MKVAIIQISDIHFQNTKDFAYSRIEFAIKSARPIINECQEVILALTGDISNMGKPDEYKVAYDYFAKFCAGIISENPAIESVDYVIVPGNHDCFFPEEQKEFRSALIERCQKNDSSIDKTIADSLLQTQSNFWDFYGSLGISCVSVKQK